MKNTVAIILAGGTGSRMKTKKPKQFLEMAGKPIILYSVEIFASCKEISGIVIVSRGKYINELKGILKKSGLGKRCLVVRGGATRQESSYEGIKACPRGTKYVLIHDAARPFVDKGTISRVLKAAKKHGASTAVIGTADTIVEMKGRSIKNIPDRRILRRVQTPQGFCYCNIMRAHKEALKKGIKESTDDCALILLSGGDITTVRGDSRNGKITHKRDLVSGGLSLRSCRSRKNTVKPGL